MEIRCPNCRNKTEWEDNPNRPFCSEACRQHDLGKWATERYRIPMHEVEEASPTEPSREE